MDSEILLCTFEAIPPCDSMLKLAFEDVGVEATFGDGNSVLGSKCAELMRRNGFVNERSWRRIRERSRERRSKSSPLCLCRRPTSVLAVVLVGK
eukprot:21923-Rhodomonas_salina.1